MACLQKRQFCICRLFYMSDCSGLSTGHHSNSAQFKKKIVLMNNSTQLCELIMKIQIAVLIPCYLKNTEPLVYFPHYSTDHCHATVCSVDWCKTHRDTFLSYGFPLEGTETVDVSKWENTRGSIKTNKKKLLCNCLLKYLNQ